MIDSSMDSLYILLYDCVRLCLLVVEEAGPDDLQPGQGDRWSAPVPVHRDRGLTGGTASRKSCCEYLSAIKI